MIAVFLLMLVGGIGLSQAVSDPKQVTLRWLRLGGIIALALLAVIATIIALSPRDPDLDALWMVGGGLTFAAVAVQLLAVQKGWRTPQRIAACGTFAAVAGAVFFLITTMAWGWQEAGATPDGYVATPALQSFLPYSLVLPIGAAAGLLGGFLMTMLLGHAYLTAGGEMTQAPFLRLVKMLAILLVLRAVASVAFGLWPYLSAEADPSINPFEATWNTVMLVARYLVGLIVPAVFTYMTWDCVRRRANQSATGILYVAGVLIIVGEGTALALLRATGLVF